METNPRHNHKKTLKNKTKKGNIKIIVKSTFNFDSIGTVIYEEGEIK